MSMKGRQTMDHEKVSFNLARLKKGGKTFEFAVDADLAIDFRNGKDIPISEIVKSEKIFSDVKKGEIAVESDLSELFGSHDFAKIAPVILKEGAIQLTAEHRALLRDVKRKKIVDMIARNAMDPKTKRPHPPARIENAMEEAKVKIDEFKGAEDQLDDIVKKLRTNIPISMDLKKLEIIIPAKYAGKAAGIVHQFAKPKQETWDNDGAYTCVIEIPAGLEADFYDRLKHATEGYMESHTLDK